MHTFDTGKLMERQWRRQNVVYKDVGVAVESFDPTNSLANLLLSLCLTYLAVVPFVAALVVDAIQAIYYFDNALYFDDDRPMFAQVNDTY